GCHALLRTPKTTWGKFATCPHFLASWKLAPRCFSDSHESGKRPHKPGAPATGSHTSPERRDPVAPGLCETLPCRSDSNMRRQGPGKDQPWRKPESSCSPCRFLA